MNFGEFMKAKRLESGLSLRNFCTIMGLDPSNWSKVERGILNLTLSGDTLKKIAGILKLNEEEQKTFFSLSTLAVGVIPKEVYSDDEILNALPVLFRTATGERPTQDEKDKLIELIKKW